MGLGQTPQLQIAAVFEEPEAAREALADLERSGFRAHLNPTVPDHLKPHARRDSAAGFLLGALLGIVFGFLIDLVLYFIDPALKSHGIYSLIGALIIVSMTGGVTGAMLGTVVGLHLGSEVPAEGEPGIEPVVIVETTRRDDAQGILERHGGRLRLA